MFIPFSASIAALALAEDMNKPRFLAQQQEFCPPSECSPCKSGTWKYKETKYIGCANPDDDVKGPWVPIPERLDGLNYEIGSGQFFRCARCTVSESTNATVPGEQSTTDDRRSEWFLRWSNWSNWLPFSSYATFLPYYAPPSPGGSPGPRGP